MPDLAATLPRPADGGTTYMFTLRRGIRYSNGTLVRASDFRRGIQRQLSFGANPGYYEGILGAQACLQHPRRCDLSAGIITNDTAGTVTFRLGQADPDFLYKLALILAAPAPPGAPDRAVGRPPFLPGTGPYKISQYRPNASLTLVRNPYFRQWSYAAQPAGYPRRDPVRAGGRPRASSNRRLSPAGADLTAISRQRSVSRDPVPGPHPHHPYVLDRVLVPQHPPAAVYQPQGPAGRQLRHRSCADPAALRPRPRPGPR